MLRRLLLVQPDVVEMLVQVVAWRNFPTLHIGAVWVDFVPPEGDCGDHSFVDHALFVLTDKGALFLWINGLFKLRIDCISFRVATLLVVVPGGREKLGDVRNRVDDRLAVKVDGHIKVLLLPQGRVERWRRLHALFYFCAQTFLPLVN